MAGYDTDAIQELTWQDVCEEIKNINKPLYDIIERVAPSSRMRFIKVRYQFGDLIVDNGVFQVPGARGELVPLTDPSVPSSLAAHLSYSAIPLGIILGKTIEIFIDLEHEIIPLNAMVKGMLFGVFELLDAMANDFSHPPWSVAAGVRSAFLLPRISEKSRHLKLCRKFNVPNTVPKTLQEQWPIFYSLSRMSEVKRDWQCEILFLSSEWFSQPKSAPDWLQLQNYLYFHSWRQAQFARDSVSLGLIWKKFATILAERSLRPRPYLADTVKNIIAIARGAAPAFIPADDSQDALPSKWIQQVYVEGYGIKDYLPTIMHLSNVRFEKPGGAVYYSLSYPILLAGAESGRVATAIMTDIRDLKLLLQTLEQAIFSKDIMINYNPLYNVSFEYYHTEHDHFEELQPSNLLAEVEPRFLNDLSAYPDRVFCSSSTFLRGCVRICVKNT